MKKLSLVIVSILIAVSASAQKWAVSTNALDYINFGTLNIEASVAVDRHYVIDLSARYNPWTFGNKSIPSKMKQNRQRTFQVGFKYYPWFVYDGWHVDTSIGYREYNYGGIFKQQTEEGDAFGAGVSGGYTLPVHKNLNIEFSAGLWAGYKTYTVYSCPTCGRLENNGGKVFVMPNNIIIGVTWVFGKEIEKKGKKRTEYVTAE